MYYTVPVANASYIQCRGRRIWTDTKRSFAAPLSSCRLYFFNEMRNGNLTERKRELSCRWAWNTLVNSSTPVVHYDNRLIASLTFAFGVQCLCIHSKWLHHSCDTLLLLRFLFLIKNGFLTSFIFVVMCLCAWHCGYLRAVLCFEQDSTIFFRQ